ncbi:hypothetical protein ABT294_21910 [Nonomuraea sp. NPDC000554]|uniref:hypothetical protein n=1 Tax=Nonomuraea sp. NPDC000554 TaxID=3154259 RepID=UPI0033180178
MKYRAAPLLVTAYGVLRIVDGLDGSRGPGPAWTAGHLAFLAALVLFVPIFWEMRRMLGRSVPATAAVAVGLAGIGCAFAQFSIDVVVGFMAADHDAMAPLFEQVKSVPGVSVAVYTAGPILFYLALVVLVAALAVRRQVSAWVPVAVLLSVLLPFGSLDLMPLGGLLMLAAFLPLARQGSLTGRHASVHA